MAIDFNNARRKMVEEQLIPRNIKYSPVLDAMYNVPRHLFVPEHQQNHAYDDSPLPIGLGQTISQPYIVAYMTEQLEPFPGMKVLEIGTGSGYQAAILAYLECHVYTMEIVDSLFVSAKETFAALGYGNIAAKLGNGYDGWIEEAPFDAIIVTAAPEYIPDKLVEQMREGGKMIIPAGEFHMVQFLKLIYKLNGKVTERNLLPVRFVPMIKPHL